MYSAQAAALKKDKHVLEICTLEIPTKQLKFLKYNAHILTKQFHFGVKHSICHVEGPPLRSGTHQTSIRLYYTYVAV